MTPQPPEDMREFGPPETQEPAPGLEGTHAPRPTRPEGLERSERGGPSRGDLNLPKRYTRWAMWGCITLALASLLIIGGFLLVTMQQSGFRTWVRFAEDVTVCRDQMDEVSGAIGRYYADNKKMPERLEDLSPTYMVNEKFLYCPADPSASAGAKRTGTSYVYRRSVPWGKGSEVVVFCPHHPAPRRLPNAPDDDHIHQIPVIRQDGAVDAITGRLSDLRDGEPKAPVAPERR